MHSTVVVLPAPLAPITPTISPAPTSRSTPSTAVRSPYRFLRPRIVTTGVTFIDTGETLPTGTAGCEREGLLGSGPTSTWRASARRLPEARGEVSSRDRARGPYGWFAHGEFRAL